MRKIEWFIVCFGLTACSQQGWNDRLASRQEQAFASRVVDQLRAGQGTVLETVAGPELQRDLAEYLPKAAPLLRPVPGIFTVQTVGVFSLNGNPPVKTFVLQGGAGSHWAVVRVVVRRSGDVAQVIGLNVTPFNSDPLRVNDFALNRRGVVGWAWLLASLVSCCTCLLAVVLVWRGRWLRRRWLWTIGSLLGFGGFVLNWSTGAWGILPLNLSVFGAQANKAGPYAPWLLSFGIPIVAIIVIIRWLRQRSGWTEIDSQ